jgi:hypothetical protein
MDGALFLIHHLKFNLIFFKRLICQAGQDNFIEDLVKDMRADTRQHTDVGLKQHVEQVAKSLFKARVRLLSD